MKLYTREQMIEAFNYGKKLEGFDWIGDMIDSLTPIELPSDEEIDNEADSFYSLESFNQTFKRGAKWVIEQIKKNAR